MESHVGSLSPTEQGPPSYDHLQRQQTLSGMPKRMLNVPLWLPPRVAQRLPIYKWESSSHQDRWTLIQANPRQAVEGIPLDRQPVGVLQHRDLDVLLALFHAWIHGDNHTSGNVNIELPELLKWMGYNKQLASAPYAEIKASLGRLRRTSIAIYKDSEKEDFAANPDKYEMTILDGMMPIKPERVGDPTLIAATLSEQVIALLTESQAIDLDVYAHLIRHPATRRIPLARVIWMTLTNFRGLNGETQCRPGWLADRYGDRRDISTTSQGRLIYRNAYNKRSRFWRAIEALAKTGALKLTATSNGWLIGKYEVPPDLPRLRNEPIQNKLWPIFDLRDTDPVAALPEPEPTAPASQSEATDRYKTIATRMAKLVPELSPKVLKEARERGFSFRQIAICIADIVTDKAIENPVGMITHKLRSVQLEAFTKPSSEKSGNLLRDHDPDLENES